MMESAGNVLIVAVSNIWCSHIVHGFDQRVMHDHLYENKKMNTAI